jgi:hypothetical protein
MTDSNERKREYLLRYLRALHRVNRAELELRATSAIGPSAIVYDDIPHGSPDLTGLERIAIKADKQLAELNRAEAEAERIHDEIMQVIEELGVDSQVNVMFYRYVCHEKTHYERTNSLRGTRQLSWGEIADRLSYSIDRVTHIHGEALERLNVDRQ